MNISKFMRFSTTFICYFFMFFIAFFLLYVTLYMENFQCFFKHCLKIINQRGIIMDNCKPYYQAYLDILAEELKPAMGCTEPIALAYAAAKARQLLGTLPEKVTIGASGSIIKNVKSVYVPSGAPAA